MHLINYCFSSKHAQSTALGNHYYSLLSEDLETYQIGSNWVEKFSTSIIQQKIWFIRQDEFSINGSIFGIL